jgi:nicotinamide phosphoribosyltransferase
MYARYKNQLLNQTYFTPAILLTDSYKLSHRDMYAEGMEVLFSTWTPRSDKIALMAERQLPLQKSEVVFFGLSMAITKLCREFNAWFARDTDEATNEYTVFVKRFLKQDVTGDHIRELHEYGSLPLIIYALPEGTVTKPGVCQMVIFNKEGEKFAWLTNYVESLLSDLLWKMPTSATIARNYYTLAYHFAELTCDPVNGEYPHLNWQMHDFSFRGMSCPEDAESSALGHLLFFGGTDTIPALFAAEAVYSDFDMGDYGSVPASEHSVGCSTQAAILQGLTADGVYKDKTAQQWLDSFDDFKEGVPLNIKQIAELISISEVLDKYPDGILSWVSDTWDFWFVLTQLLPRLKTKIMARNGKLVIRPDSGDPVKIINGDPEAPFDTPAYWGAIRLLGRTFGTTVNRKGFRELDSHIGLIYGDSITLTRAEAIFRGLARNEYASSNVVLGIGSYTYQATTRDVFGYAMKATAMTFDGVEIPLFKDPVTDDGTKKSFKGFLTTRLIDGEYKTIDGLSFEEARDLNNSAFVQYPLDVQALTLAGLNHWPTIQARLRAGVVGYQLKQAA